MASSINVKPVTGMSPSEVAKELRVLIRDQLWANLKDGNIGISQSALANQVSYLNDQRHAYRAARDETAVALGVLGAAIARRRPTEMRSLMASVATARAREDLAFRRYRDTAQWFRDAVQGNPTVNLKQAAERAYALVQALPSAADLPNGREQTTLRALTAMLKTYWGLELSQTVENLPEMMPALLEAIKAPPPPSPGPPPVIEPIELIEPLAEVVHEVPLDKTPKLPWSITVGSGGIKMSEEQITSPAYSGDFAPNLPAGDPSGWNGGNCSVVSALRALLHVRHKFNDQSFRLKDSTGYTFAAASPTFVTTYEGVSKAMKIIKDQQAVSVEGPPIEIDLTQLEESEVF